MKPEIEGVTIVLVGSFNPAIFHPAWFAHEKLIQQEEAEKADLQVVSPEASVFSIGWLELEVTSERFAVSTSQIQYLDPLRDLVLGTFNVLRHTPIQAMGINRLAHYRSASEATWHKLGHILAPKEPWAGLLQDPGMRRVTMEGKRPDQYQGRITATVEPSLKMKPGFGVFFNVNDHYDNDAQGKSHECLRMMDILIKSWQNSLVRSAQIMEKLINLQ